jgi:hypothetical protein
MCGPGAFLALAMVGKREVKQQPHLALLREVAKSAAKLRILGHKLLDAPHCDKVRRDDLHS